MTLGVCSTNQEENSGMKLTTKIAAKFVSVGHPAETEIHDSAPMAEQVKRLAIWISRVKMTDCIAVTFARTIEELQTKTAKRSESLADMLADILGPEDNDESEEPVERDESMCQGVAAAIGRKAAEPEETANGRSTITAGTRNMSISELLAHAQKNQSPESTAAERSDDHQRPHGANFSVKKD